VVERRITISAGRGNTAFRSANSPGVTTFFDKGPSINQARVKEIRVQSRMRHSIPSIRNDGVSTAYRRDSLKCMLDVRATF